MTHEPADPLAPTRRYRGTARVRARRLNGEQRWRTTRGSDLTAAAGDWLLTDGTDEWTIAADLFERDYRPLSDGRWTKDAGVDAVRLRSAATVPTREGASSAEPGDWLVRGSDGEQWPVPDDHFRTRYLPEEFAPWADDPPAEVNADLVPPDDRRWETLAAGTQRRAERFQATYLAALAAGPFLTLVLPLFGVDDPDVVSTVVAFVLLTAVVLRLVRIYRAPDRGWVRARRELESSKSAAWLRAATGVVRPGDSVRGRALATGAPVARRAVYRRFRIDDQIGFLTDRGGAHARAARRRRVVQGILALLALLVAGAQVALLINPGQVRIPAAVASLVVALLATAEAWGQFRRSGFIAASYAATAVELADLGRLDPADETELATAVTAVEHALDRELWTWVAITSTKVLTERPGTLGPAGTRSDEHD